MVLRDDATLAAVGADLESMSEAVDDVMLRWGFDAFVSAREAGDVGARDVFQRDFRLGTLRITDGDGSVANVFELQIASEELLDFTLCNSIAIGMWAKRLRIASCRLPGYGWRRRAGLRRSSPLIEIARRVRCVW